MWITWVDLFKKRYESVAFLSHNLQKFEEFNEETQWHGNIIVLF